jgi:hypothetical protein
LIKQLHHLPTKDYREEQQKSSPDKSDELLICCRKYFEAINLTYLSRLFVGVELAPFSNKVLRGCQGIIAPLPSAILDKISVRTVTKI